MIQNHAIGIREVFKGFFRDQKAVVLKSQGVGPGPKQEQAVHELRVALKKIRMLFRLTEVLSESSFVARLALRDLRRLFKAAGPLRELQVHALVLEEYEVMHSAYYHRVLQLLKDEEAVEIPKYEVARLDFRPKHVTAAGKIFKSAIRSMEEEYLLKHTAQFCRRRLTEIAEILPEDYNPVLLHKSRILLKEAMYGMNLLHLAGDLQSFPAEFQERAHMASDIAGAWHDREAFGHWLIQKLRPAGPLQSSDSGYQLLLQDVHSQSKELVTKYRKTLLPLLKA